MQTDTALEAAHPGPRCVPTRARPTSRPRPPPERGVGRRWHARTLERRRVPRMARASVGEVRSSPRCPRRRAGRTGRRLRFVGLGGHARRPPRVPERVAIDPEFRRQDRQRAAHRSHRGGPRARCRVPDRPAKGPRHVDRPAQRRRRRSGAPLRVRAGTLVLRHGAADRRRPAGDRAIARRAGAAADHRRVAWQPWTADHEAFLDHWGGHDDSEASFRRWRESPEYDPSCSSSRGRATRSPAAC